MCGFHGDHIQMSFCHVHSNPNREFHKRSFMYVVMFVWKEGLDEACVYSKATRHVY